MVYMVCIVYMVDIVPWLNHGATMGGQVGKFKVKQGRRQPIEDYSI